MNLSRYIGYNVLLIHIKQKFLKIINRDMRGGGKGYVESVWQEKKKQQKFVHISRKCAVNHEI